MIKPITQPILSQTLSWLNQLSTRPNEIIVNAVNNFICQCIKDGNWSLLDRFWLFAQDVKSNAKISIVNPTSTAITEVNAPSWIANQGYTGDGATSYLDPHWSSSMGVNFTATSCCLGGYVRTNGAAGNEATIGGTAVGLGNFLYTYFTGNTIQVNAQGSSGASLGAAVASSNGLSVAVRTSNTALSAWKDGVQIASTVSVFSSLDTTPVYILARYNGGAIIAFSAKQTSAVYFGSGTIDQLKLYKAFTNLRNSIGF